MKKKSVNAFFQQPRNYLEDLSKKKKNKQTHKNIG